MAEPSSSQLVRVFIPDIKAQKCIVLNVMDTVWTAKQVILDKIYQELTLNPLNYGLYMPSSVVGSAGKFMDDSSLLIDYAFERKVPKLELRYKQRNYASYTFTEKALQKANSKAHQKKLVDSIASGSIKKIEKLLEAGLDPNFTIDDGNTPLGVACGRNSNTQCIMPLLSGGAHIDFRGKEGLTPMHRAAIGGNAQAINILLSFGASPNYRDAKGLTPLYHTAIMGDDMGACISLLRYRAELGIQDQGGWTELHHTAKYGHAEHADYLIRFGADINAQNLVGNTPLHVAASHGQVRFALVLLKRGADKSRTNYAGQTPSQVSVLCGQHQLASEINTFTDDKIEKITLPPDYNPNAKIENKLYHTKRVSEICPIRPPNEELVDSLVGEWGGQQQGGVASSNPLEYSGQPYVLEHPKMMAMRNNSNSNLSSKDSFNRGPGDSGVGDTESISSVELGSAHSGSPGTPTGGTPTFRRPSFLQQRERLYRAGAGRYVAIQDVEPQQPGDLSLRRGMEIEATKSMQFNPTAEVPALQYVGNVEPGGSAAEAGLKTGDFIVEVNGYNTTYSTHDEVVDVVRKSGGTLNMRVVTPAMRPKSVSQQMKSHFTPTNTPGTEKKRKKEKESPRAPRFSKSSSPSGSQKSFTQRKASKQKSDKETVIGEKSSQSPILPRSGKFDWDSHGEESPSSRRKASAGAGGNVGTLPYTVSEERGERSSSMSGSPAGSWRSRSTSNVSRNEVNRESPSTMRHHSPSVSAIPPAGNRMTSRDKCKTLPASSKHKPPKFSTYTDSDSDSNSDEDTSSFASALRESREKIKKKSLQQPSAPAHQQMRERANTSPVGTPPLRNSPLLVKRSAPSAEDNKMSPLQLEILKASQERSNRISKQQTKLTNVAQSKEPKESERNSLADVLSRRLDSMSTKTKSPEHSEDSFDESPGPYSKSKHVEEVRSKSFSGIRDKRPASKAPPPLVKPKPKKDRPEGSESPLPPGARSEEETAVERDTSVTLSPSSPWQVKLRHRRNLEHSKSMSAAKDTGTDWRSALKSGGGKELPVQMEKKSVSSEKDESEPETGEFVLPPPLPDGANVRHSFSAVEPPEAFLLEMEETNITDLPPPPPPTLTPPPAPKPAKSSHMITEDEHMGPPLSPAPPPLPESSPPPKLPSVFIFPEGGAPSRESTKSPDSVPISLPSSVPTSDIGDLPSPIPSPVLERSPIELSTSSPLPPPSFGEEEGFWIEDSPKSTLPPPSPPKTPPISSPPLPSDPPSPASPDSPPPLPTEPPPPLPSEPPPLLTDSDTSYDQLTVTSPNADVGKFEDILSSPSSLGSSPQSYEMTPNPPSPAPIAVGREGEGVKKDMGGSGTKLAPLVAKKPKRGFTPPPHPVEKREDDVKEDITTKQDPIAQPLPPPSSPPPPPVTPSPPPPVTPSPPPPVKTSPPPPASPLSLVSPPSPVTTSKQPPTSPPPLSPTSPPSPAPSTPSGTQPHYKTTPLGEWSVEDVCEWLTAIGLGEHVESFQENEMMGEHLVDITKEDLKELGVKKLGHQKSFLSKLSQMNK